MSKPDLAILDIGMSLMNGVEATRQIARRVPSTRIIVLSGLGRCRGGLVGDTGE